MQTVSKTSLRNSSIHSWFDCHFAELTRRCHRQFRLLPVVEREEAVAETLASIFKYAVSAAARGRLSDLTPYTLILFFSRSCRSGRKMAGYKAVDVMSETARRQRHHAIIPLHQPAQVQTDRGTIVVKLSEVLADAREGSPAENARRNIDYPAILDREKVSHKGRRVFEYLCQTHGKGNHRELARELGITPSRISQIKHELARSLARHGYGLPTKN
jgi:hypothetical protein